MCLHWTFYVKEYKAHFIVEVVEAFPIWFGFSHHTLTSVKLGILITVQIYVRR